MIPDGAQSKNSDFFSSPLHPYYLFFIQLLLTDPHGIAVVFIFPEKARFCRRHPATFHKNDRRK